MFITILQFNEADLGKKQQEYAELTKTFDSRMALWTELQNFFSEKNVTEIISFRLSYWRWYVDLTWRHLERMEKDVLINDALARQIPMALLLNYNVLEKVLWYFGLHVFDDQAQQSLYVQIKRSFMESEFVVGTWQGKPVTIKDLTGEIILMNGRGNNSLQEAEFRSKVQQLFFPKDLLQEKFIFANPDDAVSDFIDLVHFFLGVKPEKIWYVVEGVVHPDTYALGGGELSEASFAESSVETEQESVETVTSESAEKPTFAEIKQTIESKFTKDADGQFLDQAAVLSMLDTMAAEYNDQQILDLYYYNEADGQFYWNEELLNR